MAVTITGRKTIREKWAALVQADMVGAGKSLAAVYAYQKGKLAGVTPCMVIVSEGTEPVNPENSVETIEHLGFHSFILYEDSDFTEQQSEDAADAIAKDIRELVELYSDRTQEVNPEWTYAEMGRSTIDAYTDLEGEEYRHEYFQVRVLCPNSG